jgi:signal transduction histidine kinase
MTTSTKQIELRITDTLPVFRTRKVPLELVLRNLISNAIKHHDKPAGLIEISAKLNDGFVEFVVKDNGPGIAPEHQQRVFGMFQTLKPRDEIEGSGIGLALIKKAVETVGGKVGVESDGKNGSLFRFTWPLNVVRESA